MERSCIICGNQCFTGYLEILDKCRHCGFVSFNLEMPAESLGQIYNSNYFKGGEYCDYAGDQKTLEKNFRLRLKVLDKYLKPGTHTTLLEIGSAYGFFLNCARNRFKQVAGIDIAREGCAYAREHFGFEVAEGDYLLLKPDFQPGVVCLWDTIEHLPRPDLFIAKISREIIPGGLLCLTTGDIDSFNARLRGKKWRLIHPPTHLHYFSRQTISMLLRQNGFRIIHFAYCGFYRSLQLVLHHLLVEQNRSPKLFNCLDGLGITRISFYSNLFDIMYIIAEKEIR